MDKPDAPLAGAASERRSSKNRDYASNESRGAGWFVSTHWSVVLAAKEGDDAVASEAMERLCRTYWPPLYAFIRREGHADAEAKDLTQEFFLGLV